MSAAEGRAGDMTYFREISRVASLNESEAFRPILKKVEEIGEALQVSGEQSEQEGRLAPAAVELLRDSGATHMRVPAELGGTDLSVTEQMVILARIAEFDSSSAWCSMISNNGIGGIANFLSDDGISEVFGGDGPLPLAASVAAPGGGAEPVRDGFRVSGAWRFCSNVFAADYVRCVANINGDPDQPVMIVVPQDQLRILKTWNVTGLRGTGSSDFALDDVFVPKALTADMPLRQLRGRHNYVRDSHGTLAVYEHAAFAIGLARRAMSLVETMLREKPRRGGDREVIQSEFGRLQLDLDAAELLTYATFSRLDEGDDQVAAEIRVGSLAAVASQVTDLGLRCAIFANRRAGTDSLFLPNRFEGTLRDMLAAQAHVLMNDRNYATYGANRITPGGAPAASGSPRAG